MKKAFGIVIVVLMCFAVASCFDGGREMELSEAIVSRDTFSESEVVIKSSDPSEKEPDKAAEVPEEPVAAQECDFVLNTNTKKFHYPSCSSATQTKDKNKSYHTGTRDELIDMGYSPCGRCKP